MTDGKPPSKLSYYDDNVLDLNYNLLLINDTAINKSVNSSDRCRSMREHPDYTFSLFCM